jgi:hypothetical protein
MPAQHLLKQMDLLNKKMVSRNFLPIHALHQLNAYQKLFIKPCLCVEIKLHTEAQRHGLANGIYQTLLLSMIADKRIHHVLFFFEGSCADQRPFFMSVYHVISLSPATGCNYFNDSYMAR